MEKDREATEKRILKAAGEIIIENGFEKTGINAVAARAEVSKMLIYRYFGSMDGLLATYIRHHDFWINFSPDVPTIEYLGDFLKQMFREQITQLRKDKTLKKLYRWELSASNPMITELREKREEKGVLLIEMVSKLANSPKREVASMATLINAAISYLVLLEDFCPIYNEIPLQENKGWEQIMEGIDLLIDKWLEKALKS